MIHLITIFPVSRDNGSSNYQMLEMKKCINISCAEWI